MATKIRGITIELGADASGVLDAVKSVNSEIRSTSAQLKDVDKLLKLDPTNTELLTQKTKLLQEQIANCNEKLTTLKEAQDKMDQNGVDHNSEQYQALQREIIATEQELAKLKDTTGSGSEALAKISAVTGEVGQKMEDAGKKMSVLSAGLIALGAGALKAFNDVDEGADIVIKKTGATGDAADALEEVYKSVAQNIVGDWSDIGSAVGEVSTRFGVTGDELQDLSEEFLKFADINDVDVTSSVDGVQKALAAFGLDASDARSLLDRLTSVSQNTGASVDTLTEGLVQNGTAFAEMGLSAEQAAVLMGQMETSGANSETVMNGLRKALKNATDEGIPLDEALANLQDTILNGTGSVDGLTAAYDLFGKSGDQIYGAVKNGTLDFANLALSLGDVTGAVDDTYAATLDGSDQMALAWQNMQLAAAELGSAIGETLAPIMEKITSVIQDVTEWFGNLDDGTKSTIVTIGLIVAALGPLLVIGGKVLQGISSITGALSTLGTSTFGPLGLVIAAVGVAVGAFAAWEQSLRDAYAEASPFTESLNEIKAANEELATEIDNTKQKYEDQVTSSEASAAAAEALYEKLQSLMEGYDGSAEAGAQIQAVIGEINELLPDMGLQWDEATNSLNLNTEEIYNQIAAMQAQAKAAALQDMYTESLKQQYEAEKNLAEATNTMDDVLSTYGLTQQDVNNYLENGNAVAGYLTSKIVEAYGPFDNFEGIINECITAIGNYNDASDNATEATENVTFAEEEWAIAIADAALAADRSARAIEERYLQAFGESVPESLHEAIWAAEDAGIKIPQSIVDGLINGKISVDEATSEIIALLDKQEEAQAQGQTTANAYVEETASEIQKQGKRIGDEASTAVANMDQSGSAYTYGSDTAGSFAEGIEAQSGQVESSSKIIYSEVVDELSGLPDEMGTTGESSGSELNAGFSGWLETVHDTVSSMYSYFYDELYTTLGSNIGMWGRHAGSEFNAGVLEYADDVLRTAQTLADNIYKPINSLSWRLYTAGSQAANRIMNGLSSGTRSIYAIMYNAGGDAGNGFYNGLSAWEYNIRVLANNIAVNAANAARAALQISSPSKVMMKIGEYTGEGLAMGLEHSESAITSAMGAIAADIANTNLDMNAGMNALNARAMSGTQSSVMADSANSEFGDVVGLLSQYLPYLAQQTNIVLDDGTLAGHMAPAINNAIADIQTRAARG